MADKLLSGLRALDLTNEMGFLCGKVLADMGVDVIKIEKPGGDDARKMPPFYHDEASPEKSLYWAAYNMNKRGITLDLEDEADRKTFKELVKTADFVIESFRPGYLASLGLDYEHLAEINPQIIMTSITPYGQTGPYAGLKASDLTVTAMSVVLSEVGDPDRAPVRVRVPQSYMVGGMCAAEGTMVAYHHRVQTGIGQHVDVSLQECMQHMAEMNALVYWEADKVILKRVGQRSIGAKHKTPVIWECKDGYVAFVLYGGMAGARTNPNLTAWMDSEGMAPEFMKKKDWANFDFASSTQEEVDAICDAIAAFFKTHTKDELWDGAVAKDIMLYKVCDPGDLVHDIQLEARDFWVDVEHKELGTKIRYPGAFAKLSETPLQDWKRAPLPGEHNAEVLAELKSGNAEKRSPVIAGAQNPAEVSSALRGVKVLGFVTLGVGPLTLRPFAAHGATVIAIESMDRPDLSRTMGKFKDNIQGLNRNFTYAWTNAGKYGMCVNLKNPRAPEVTRKLIEWADVVVDNFRPGVMERMGLGYEALKAIKPDIIVLSSSQQGATGPLKSTAAHGPHLSGLAGLHHLTGWADRPPCTTIPAYPDFIAPRFGAIAILAALDYRRRTGKGQFIDISQYEAAIQFLTPAILEYTANKRVMGRAGNADPLAAPHGVYRCKGDDEWCAIAVFTDAEWKAFCDVLGNPDWTRSERFATLAARKQNEDELNRLVEEWTSAHTNVEVMERLQAAGVDAGVVRTIKDAIDCPQLAHRHYWSRIEHPEMGETLVGGIGYILSKTPYRWERPAPCIGEHTFSVCTEFLGMSIDEFVELDAAGALT